MVYLNIWNSTKVSSIFWPKPVRRLSSCSIGTLLTSPEPPSWKDENFLKKLSSTISIMHKILAMLATSNIKTTSRIVDDCIISILLLVTRKGDTLTSNLRDRTSRIECGLNNFCNLVKFKGWYELLKIIKPHHQKLTLMNHYIWMNKQACKIIEMVTETKYCLRSSTTGWRV